MLQFLGIILSALIAAILYRNTEFRKYLLKQRIDTFSSFLKEAEPCRRNAVTSIFAAQLNKDEFDFNKLPNKIAELFWPIIINQFSVKLLLEPDHRSKFDEEIKKLSGLTIHAHMANKEELDIDAVENVFKNIEIIMRESIDKTKSVSIIQEFQESLKL